MQIEMTPIGIVQTDETMIPRHWSYSDVKGTLVIDEQYREGLKGITPGDRIVVIFYFHKSRRFTQEYLTQHPRGDVSREKRGVFDLASPVRPNPLGMSIVTVIDIKDTVISVKGLDILDGTPILDIKPFRL